MKFISPKPGIWHDIYNKLERFWINDLGKENTPPPKPLILAGWNFSNDFDKMIRWNQTLRWAADNNCEHIIPELTVEQKYIVSQLNDYIPFQYSSWNEKPQVRPSDSKIEFSLSRLIVNWPTILDKNFGLLTKPVEFSGKKARRLVVSYKQGYLPPWGSWTNHLANGSPSIFTELRKKVNEIISPHEVDHIDFKIEKSDNT